MSALLVNHAQAMEMDPSEGITNPTVKKLLNMTKEQQESFIQPLSTDEKMNLDEEIQKERKSIAEKEDTDYVTIALQIKNNKLMSNLNSDGFSAEQLQLSRIKSNETQEDLEKKLTTPEAILWEKLGSLAHLVLS
jgi:predicted transport protein